MILHTMAYSQSAPGRCDECVKAAQTLNRITFRSGAQVMLCPECMPDVASGLNGDFWKEDR